MTPRQFELGKILTGFCWITQCKSLACGLPAWTRAEGIGYLWRACSVLASEESDTVSCVEEVEGLPGD